MCLSFCPKIRCLFPEPQQREHYFTSATWVSTTEISVVWLNRPQNVSVMSICKSPMWKCQEVGYGVRIYDVRIPRICSTIKMIKMMSKSLNIFDRNQRTFRFLKWELVHFASTEAPRSGTHYSSMREHIVYRRRSAAHIVRYSRASDVEKGPAMRLTFERCRQT